MRSRELVPQRALTAVSCSSGSSTQGFQEASIDQAQESKKKEIYNGLLPQLGRQHAVHLRGVKGVDREIRSFSDGRTKRDPEFLIQRIHHSRTDRFPLSSSEQKSVQRGSWTASYRTVPTVDRFNCCKARVKQNGTAYVVTSSQRLVCRSSTMTLQGFNWLQAQCYSCCSRFRVSPLRELFGEILQCRSCWR